MAYSNCYPDKAPKLNRLLEMLCSAPRRELIHYFESVSQADTDSIDAVVSHLDSRMPSRNPAGLKVALHHKHLPKLEAAGWVEYDVRSEEIRYHGNEVAEPLLLELATVFSDS